MGRIGLINSGGASVGAGDLAEAVRTAVINKRAGGMGLISGRKAVQRPMTEGVELLNAIQDVYLDPSVDLACRPRGIWWHLPFWPFWRGTCDQRRRTVSAGS